MVLLYQYQGQMFCLQQKGHIPETGKRLVKALCEAQEQIWIDLLKEHKKWIDILTNKTFKKILLSLIHKYKKKIMIIDFGERYDGVQMVSLYKRSKLENELFCLQDLNEAIENFNAIKEEKPPADKLYLNLPNDEPLLRLRKSMSQLTRRLCALIFTKVFSESNLIREAKVKNRLPGLFAFPDPDISNLLYKFEVDDSILCEIDSIVYSISISEPTLQKEVCLGDITKPLVPIKAKFRNPLSMKRMYYWITPPLSTISALITFHLPSFVQLRNVFQLRKNSSSTKKSNNIECENMHISTTSSKCRKVNLPHPYFYEYASQRFFEFDPNHLNITKFAPRLSLKEIEARRRSIKQTDSTKHDNC